DGFPGRMQMYVFNLAGSGVNVTAPGGIAGSYASGVANFGPQSFSITGDIVRATPNDACSAVDSTVAGKIALVDRGTCTFLLKAQAVAAAGAIACIIVDNAPAFLPPGLGGTGTVTIPVLSITQADGNTIKTALASGTVTAQLVRQPSVS